MSCHLIINCIEYLATDDINEPYTIFQITLTRSLKTFQLSFIEAYHQESVEIQCSE